jgi:hypothetical protein
MDIHNIRLTKSHKDEIMDPDELTSSDLPEAKELRRKVQNAKTHQAKKALIKEYLEKRIKNLSQWNETKAGNL